MGANERFYKCIIFKTGFLKKRTRWLLVVFTGVVCHLFITTLTVAKLAPFCLLPSYTSGLLLSGQVNFQTADAIGFIEWFILLILFAAFSISFLRESSE